MNPLKAVAQKIKSINAPKNTPYAQDLGHSISGPLAYDYHRRNDYENAFPSIRVISQRFAAIEPYTVDRKGKGVASNILDRLYTPNTDMSAYDFREALAVMSLVHNKVYIRVHHKTLHITADSITGFTFLEGVSEHIVDGEIQFWLPNGEKLTKAQVIVLRSINPYKISDGFSHAYAARRWTNLDDLIADYQTGFFNNGAVPSGQFIITAKTTADYQDIVNGIKAHHQGASKNNNLMFAHRPVGLDNKPLDSQVEWVPFSTQNKDMALKDLFEQANKKIDSTYGVPASLRGVNDTNTYASIRVDNLLFVENTLEPFTLKIWQKFNHELTRITGGTGLAIAFDLELPVIADEEKVKAEAKQTDAQTVINLTQAGYTPQSAIRYVETGDITTLIKEEKPVEKPEVLDSEEAKGTPDQPVDLSRRSEKAADPKAKALSDNDRADYEAQLEQAIYERMEAQIEAAQSLVSSKAVGVDQPLEDDEDAKLTDAMLAVLLSLIAYQGPIEQKLNAQLLSQAGINVGNIQPFRMTGMQEAEYRDYVGKVGRSYNAQTAERIRNIILAGRQEGLSASEMRAQLKGLLTEKWRIDRIVKTEINHAGNSSSLWSMQNISKETGAKVDKVWMHTGGDDPCPLCLYMLAMDPVDVFEDYVELGESIELDDGKVWVNDFMPIDGSRDIHPHGHCRQGYRVRR
ncbi:phage portal protein [Prescottella equi]|uniref:phage portal protein n=1 Tax=Rhodococcus hoagii TaxID=43767 RepID=UPI001F5B5B4C|nr:phage portal protein [Prescottella equi]UNQ40944.1 phage portal protein [Prescottella equi]